MGVLAKAGSTADLSPQSPLGGARSREATPEPAAPVAGPSSNVSLLAQAEALKKEAEKKSIETKPEPKKD